MIIKDINECDFINYGKHPSMFIATPKCTFKCDRLNKCDCCQNSKLALERDIDMPIDEIIKRYLNNSLTSAIVFGGLEPMDTDEELLIFVYTLREVYRCNDDIVIYTGYTKEELEVGYRDGEGYSAGHVKIWEKLKTYPNIIVKYGRFILNDKPRYDDILCVELASQNQYAEVLKNGMDN